MSLLLTLLMNVYLVDKILKKDEERGTTESRTKLMVVAVLLIVPFGILHFLDFRKITWKVSGS